MGSSTCQAGGPNPGAVLSAVLLAVALGGSAPPAAASACEAACNSCHPSSGTGGMESGPGQPRWNPLGGATASFAVYTTAEGGTAASDNRAGHDSPSRLCLSCHDGTVSRPVRARPAGSDADIASSHPVGVRYAAATGPDPGPHALRSSLSPSGLGGSIEDDLLVGGRLECTSCHERHQGPGRPHGALRLTTAGGRLCLTCHAK